MDIAIIAIYLSLTILVGLLSRGKQRGATDYFTASGSMSGGIGSLLVGLSIAATFFSGISFIAVPGIVYREGIGLLFALACLPVCWLILRYWFLPRYLRLARGEPYAFLQERLGAGIRTQVAVLYVLLRLGWMATLIYAPTLAVLELLRLDAAWLPMLILALGIASTIYTALGGLQGVIVTDAIQFIIIALGIGLTCVIILLRLPAPLSEVWTTLRGESLISWPGWQLNPDEIYTWWSITLGFGVTYLATYLADQMSLQRYLAAGTVKAANRSFASNIVGVFIVMILLITTGLCLRVWFSFAPVDKLVSRPDSVFPYFIAHELPVGLSGLIIAALLAATMSSITSGINALASVITMDLWQARFSQEEKDGSRLLRISRLCSFLLGALCTLLALFAERLGSLFEASQAILGLFLGPILTAVILAISGYRIGGRTFFVATTCAVVVGGYALGYVASVWTTFITLSLCMLLCVLLNNLGCRLSKIQPVSVSRPA